ncbi:hypothetical protein N644_3174 [Lactiplantibacillus paraplantarum]|nr:hypothetical protein N644_3174 [Lactiplantibacillus paraplantarum]
MGAQFPGVCMLVGRSVVRLVGWAVAHLPSGLLAGLLIHLRRCLEALRGRGHEQAVSRQADGAVVSP